MGNGDQDVIFRHNPKIAVETLYGMEKKGLCARAGQCCNNLSADQAGFSNAGDNDPPFAAVDQFHRLR